MTEFEKNHPTQLKEFLKQLNYLVDEFHPNIYTLSGVFQGIQTIEIAILNELNKDKEI
jgi:Na+-transporting NADH:ubiquinone oxidoreductase subunit NqrE